MGKWEVVFTRKAAKQARNLREAVFLTLQLLTDDLGNKGPAPGQYWHNYSKHCHLLKGNPTYVCCWKVLDKQNKIIEVYYVGKHGKAPY